MDRTVRDVEQELLSILHRMDELLLVTESAVHDLRLRIEAGEACDPCLARIRPLLVPLSTLYQELRSHRGSLVPREGESCAQLQQSIDTAQTRLTNLVDAVQQASMSADVRIRDLAREVEASTVTPGALPVGAVAQPQAPVEFGDPRRDGGAAE